jgi:hypothetical protein
VDQHKVSAVKRSLLAVLVLSLAACTPRQVADYLIAVEHSRGDGATVVLPAADVPAGASMEIQPACADVVVAATGWPDGATMILGLGSDPPTGVSFADGAASVVLPVSDGQPLAYHWTVRVVLGPDNSQARFLQGDFDRSSC